MIDDIWSNFVNVMRFPGGKMFTLLNSILILGRTGRCQQSGTAYTYFTSGDCRQARALVAVLRETGQTPPAKLNDMARNSNGSSGKHL